MSSLHSMSPTSFEMHEVRVPGNSSFVIDSHYSFIRSIGSGAYGVVISAEDARDSSKVAVKKVRGVKGGGANATRLREPVRRLTSVAVTCLLFVEPFNPLNLLPLSLSSLRSPRPSRTRSTRSASCARSSSSAASTTRTSSTYAT